MQMFLNWFSGTKGPYFYILPDPDAKLPGIDCSRLPCLGALRAQSVQNRRLSWVPEEHHVWETLP